jgi:arsenate reductase (glutaredoxin)
MKIYGIPNCDTIKKTLDWFKANDIDYEFHDYKKEGITATKLKSWLKQVGMDVIINKKSTTWKALSAEEQQAMGNEKTAIDIILKNESIIKRPVIEKNEKVIMVGFKQTDYDQKLKSL